MDSDAKLDTVVPVGWPSMTAVMIVTATVIADALVSTVLDLLLVEHAMIVVMIEIVTVSDVIDRA